MSSAYSVSLFTDWRQPRFNQVWLKHRSGDEPGSSREMTSRGATPATRNLHPISTMPAENCTPQMNVPGPWDERLPHFRMEFTPSAGEELQSEYFVPRYRAADALRAIDTIRAQVAPLLQICEVRTIAADGLWMSPFYRQPCAAIHFTWKKNWLGVRALLPTIEQCLVPFEPRPHWGKLFTLAPTELAHRYPRMADFRELASRLDPLGKFRNGYLDRYIPP
jgi:xylitol oxidase